MRSPITRYMRVQIVDLVWPVILEGFGVMLVGLLTTAMVGRLGAVSLAAVGLATTVQMASSIIFAAAGTGAAAIVAREVGAGNWERVRLFTGQAVLLGLILGFIVAAGGYGMAPHVFVLSNAEPEVVDLGSDLLRIVFLFTPFYLLVAIGNNVLRAMGKTKLVFYMSAANQLLSLTVAYLLIFGHGVPQLGAYGAAWGTALGQLTGGLTVMAVLVLYPDVRLRLRDVLSWHGAAIRLIMQISVPAGLEQLALQGGRIVFTFMLAGAGAVQFAGHQIALQVESISFMPGFGFCIAAMTLVGQHLGKGLPHRAEKYVQLTNVLAFWSMTLMGLIFFVFAEELTSLFISDPQVVYWGALCVRIAAFEQPTLALLYVYSGALRGAGDTKWPMYITFLGVWAIRLPLIYLFIVVWHYEIYYAWIITVIDFLFRAIVFWHRFTLGKWQDIQITLKQS